MLAAVLHACAPLAQPDTMAAIALVESSFNPFAIHDNTTNREYQPHSRDEAIAIIDALPGHVLDVGVVQVDFATGVNAPRTVQYFVCVDHDADGRRVPKAHVDRICGSGKTRAYHRYTLSAYDALDPCRDAFAGSAILQEAWERATVDFDDRQSQLMGAIALYNTGSSYAAPEYVRKVVTAASDPDVLATATYARSLK
jgi:type IV secretion system protein VirB1